MSECVCGLFDQVKSSFFVYGLLVFCFLGGLMPSISGISHFGVWCGRFFLVCMYVSSAW